METGFEYYAFISYKREDEKWAKWLQNKLEGYKLPAIIRKEIPDLPKRIRPIFRDKTDLGAGLLTEVLLKELEKSRNLIVICSPKSAKSEWVGREIDAFVELGRSNNIIPFIVDGEPNSNNERECFHPFIKEKIPDTLGINVNEIGKQQAFLKVAAKLLDLRFDVLWNRFSREQQKQRIIAVIIGLLLLLSAVFVWDYNRTKVEYFADYVDRWGIPEGIIKLDKSQVKQRYCHYCFESSQRKLRRVIYANSAGTPVNHSNTEYTDRPSIQVFTYIDNRLSITELKNAQNKTVATYFWGGKNFDRIDIKQSKEEGVGGAGAILASSFTSAFNEQNSSKADIKRFKLTRNEEGFITRKEFKKENGNDEIPACDANGIWGFEYNLDRLGRIIQIRYLGDDGKYLSDSTGVMGRMYEYDKYGNISQTVYFDKNKKAVLNDQLLAVCLSESDDRGNLIKEAYFGIDGKPVLDENGVATLEQKFDEHGNAIEVAYFGIDGKPVLTQKGYSKRTSKYDERGNKIEEAYFGIDGESVFDKNGYSKWTAKYDEAGNAVEGAYFGIDGKPVMDKDGYSKWTAKYDENGNMIELNFFDTEGKVLFK